MDERAVGLRVVERRADEILGFTDRIVRGWLPHVHRPESILGSPDEVRRRPERRRIAGKGRRIGPAELAVDDRFPETQRELCDSVLGARPPHGEEIVRPGDAGHMGIEAVPDARADDFLNDDGHVVVALCGMGGGEVIT
jgi:hypothetical protein